MQKVHGPCLHGFQCLLPVITQLWLHPPLGSQLIVYTANLLAIDLPALPLKEDVDPPVAVADTVRTST